MNSGMSPNLTMSSGSTWRKSSMSPLRLDSTGWLKPIDFLPSRRSMISSSPANAPPQMNRMFDGVDVDELLVRVLAPALGRHARDGAFEDLEQRLLHALARDVARDRGVLGLARDLVDLVDVDDAALGALDVKVGRREQLQEDVLDVLTDVARLGQAPSRRRWRRARSACAPASGRGTSCHIPSGRASSTLDFATSTSSSCERPVWMRL